MNDLAARIGAGPPKKPVGLVKVPERTASEVEAVKEAEASAEDSVAAKARAQMASILGSGPPASGADAGDKSKKPE